MWKHLLLIVEWAVLLAALALALLVLVMSFKPPKSSAGEIYEELPDKQH